MSKYLPIENITYKTSLSKEQTISRLNENIEAEKSFSFNNSYSKPYIGEVKGNTFNIKRVIGYRNSFLPIITGEVYTDFNGTKVKVNMKPHSFVFIFMIIWLGGVSLACSVSIFSMFSQGFNIVFLVPFGMLLFGVILLFGAFKTESSRSKKDLLKILEAEFE